MNVNEMHFESRVNVYIFCLIPSHQSHVQHGHYPLASKDSKMAGLLQWYLSVNLEPLSPLTCMTLLESLELGLHNNTHTTIITVISNLLSMLHRKQ